MPETKYRPLQIKQVPTDGSGIFTGLASTYGGAPDHQGDVVERGAFAESILKWRALGDYPPILFNHSMSRPNAKIGRITSMQEIEEGLLITAQLNLQNKLALETYEALLNGSLEQLSIGYVTLAEYKREDGKGGSFNVLSKLDLIEVSIVPVPANPRARVLDVKSRTDGDGESAKKQKATEILQMVNDVQHTDERYVPALYAEIGRAMRFEIDDPDSDVDDVVGAAKAVLERHLNQNRWRLEDDERRAKWATYAVKKSLDDLDADLAVGEKAQRHQSPDETDLIGLRRHLTTKHSNQIVSVRDVERMQIDELVAAHRVMHGMGKSDKALTKAVDDLIEDVRWQANRDRADRDAFEAANAAIQLSGRAPGFSPDAERERELELQQRDLERVEQRAAERDAERASAEESARISREDRNWHGDSYWTNDSAVPQPETVRDRVEPRVVDQTVPEAGTTFSAPIYGVEGSDYRLTPPETLPEAPEAAGETYRVRTASVDTPEPTVPLESADTFRIYANQPEDSKVVAPETPVPTVNETTGESFRMPVGGEVTESLDSMKDGEQL